MPQAANYEQAIESLYALGHELAEKPGQPRRKWELAHMRTLCAALGDPQRAFPAVLIAGTNGKGSTAATLASILHAAGHRTALYTSPHLVRVNERIAIFSGERQGIEISDDDFARLYFRVDDTAQNLLREGTLPHPPSFFEVITALAFTYFAEQHAEIAVLEVGLGGRLDATNIVEPLLSVITDIALDHTEYLGNTLTEIAHEKAGILREDGILVTLPQHPLANQAIGEKAVALNVTGINAAEYMPMRNNSVILAGAAGEAEGPVFSNRYSLTVLGETIEVNSPLAGAHQQRNIALAVAAAVTLAAVPLKAQKNYAIRAENIADGIRNTRWPGRLEYIPTKNAPILLDVAHNPAGVWALRSILAHLPGNSENAQPKTLIFSCLRDKALTEMAQILFPLFGDPGDQILVPPIANPRAASVEEILAAANALDIHAKAVENVAKAVKNAQLTTPKDGIIIVTGSVYLIGAVRAELLGELK
jgi:dihydrofolate synthase / folylpolyglutamate synthase